MKENKTSKCYYQYKIIYISLKVIPVFKSIAYGEFPQKRRSGLKILAIIFKKGVDTHRIFAKIASLSRRSSC